MHQHIFFHANNYFTTKIPQNIGKNAAKNDFSIDSADSSMLQNSTHRENLCSYREVALSA